jgi:hypothetical protein
MPRSEGAAGEGPNDLIRDISRSGASRNSSETSEHRLMRAADDPLAVREIMTQVDEAGPVPQLATAMPGEATITLSRNSLMHGSLGHATRRGRMHYDGCEAPPEDLDQTSAFAPTRQDREEALDLGPPPAQAEPPGWFPGPRAGLAGLTVLAVLIWVNVLLS